MSVTDFSALWWQLLGIVYVVSAFGAAMHAILKKQEPQSALAWVGLIFLSPYLGTALYLLFGINRIRRRALKLKERRAPPVALHNQTHAEEFEVAATPLILFGDKVCRSLVSAGNEIRPWYNGDEAYPEMLAAIDGAKHAIALATYIFDNDAAGKRFFASLHAAHARGVQVRVLVDGVGSLYSVPPISRLFRRSGIAYATFLPTFPPWHLSFSNLRYHRKLLVVDGCRAFTGGMNIRAGHWHEHAPIHPIRDVHFEVTGPAVNELHDVFVNDWYFATGEIVTTGATACAPVSASDRLARVVPDGPDANHRKIRWLFLGAIADAKQSIRIMTPYFTPESAIIAALSTAAMRGIEVTIVVPTKSNLPWMHWAMQAIIAPLIEKGCRVFWSPPPFEHTKLMTIDDRWTFFGSANWDTRSLRLNFELNVECHDRHLTAQANKYIDARTLESRAIMRPELSERMLPVRLRNGIARLFLPIL